VASRSRSPRWAIRPAGTRPTSFRNARSRPARSARFGTLDPSDGGNTRRYSLSYTAARTDADGAFRLNAYAIRSRLDLYSNFSFFLEHPADLDPAAIAGDQFEQAERRSVFGLATSRSWNGTLGGRETTTTIGLQVRHDRIGPLGLYSTVARDRVETTQESRVRETSVGVYLENALQWTPVAAQRRGRARGSVRRRREQLDRRE
jgi:hypothetical protein